MKKIYHLVKESLRSEERDYTKMELSQAIPLLAIPMILEMLMESLFAVVDVYWVGKISTNAVAAVGLTESLSMLIYSLAIGLSTAATAMVARRVGEKNPEAAAEAAGQTILIAILLSIGISFLGFYYSEALLGLMGAEPELIAEGHGYTKILLSTNIVIILLFLLNGIFRGAGNAFLAMISLWVANGFNLILDPLLIFGMGPIPEMGVEGAAVATSIGRGIGVALQLYILFNGPGVVKLNRKLLIWKSDLVKRILSISWGGTSQFLIASASWIFLMRIIAEFGSAELAGYTFAIRIIIFTILPCWGLSNAAATLVGQHLGADQPDMAEASGWKVGKLNTYFLLVVSILYFIFAEFLLGIFTQDPEVLKAGILCLRTMSVGYVFFAYGMVLTQAFNGAGDTKTPTYMNIVCFWLVEIPLAYILALHLEHGPFGVYLAICISETLLAILAIWLFKKGNWKLKKV